MQHQEVQPFSMPYPPPSVFSFGIDSVEQSERRAVLDQLAFIEHKTGGRFPLPEGDIPFKDMQAIHVVARILKTGRVAITISEWEATLTAEQAERMLEDWRDGKPKRGAFYYPQDPLVPSLGVDVPLGPVLTGIHQVYVKPEDLAALRDNIAAGGLEGKARLRISAYEEHPSEARYVRWLPVGDAADVYRQPTFKDDAPEQFFDELMDASYQNMATLSARFAALLAALRKGVTSSEAGTANYIVTCTDDELLNAFALYAEMKNMPQDVRFLFAAKLFEHDVLSSGKAARFAGMDRGTFLMNLHTADVAVLDLDEEEMENEARYAAIE